MRTKRITSLIIAIVLILGRCGWVLADEKFDTKAPEINSFLIDQAEEFDTNNKMNISMDIIEDGSGLKEICIMLVDSDGKCRALEYTFKSPVFTGKVSADIDLKEMDFYLEEKEYEINTISLIDSNGNKKLIIPADENDESFTKKINITNSVKPEANAPTISSFSIVNNMNINASAGFDAHVSIKEESYVREIEVEFMGGSLYFSALADIDEKISTGDYDIHFNFYGKYIKEGTYYIREIKIVDSYGNKKSIAVSGNLTSVVKDTRIEITNVDGPFDNNVLSAFNILEEKITTPNILNMSANLDLRNKKLKAMSLTLENENGYRKELYWEGELSNLYGSYTFKIPLNSYMENGTYQLIKVNFYGKDWKKEYSDFSLDMRYYDNHTLEIKSQYDIAYYGSTANIGLAVQAINAMKDGQVAMLDYTNNDTASSQIFKAINGRDVTVVFEGKDAQWIFNGKDINPQNIKDIKLNIVFKELEGSKYGYADSKKVLAIIFENNGQLPGVARVKINSKYLSAKYGFKSEMILSYFDKTPEVVDKYVKCDADGFAILNIIHNSTYILSGSLPRLFAPKNIKVKQKGRKVYLSWEKVYGTLGYKIYRSKKKNGTFKLIKKTSELKYKDNAVKVGGTYYYKICAYGKHIKAVVSASKKVRIKKINSKVKVKQSDKKNDNK